MEWIDISPHQILRRPSGVKEEGLLQNVNPQFHRTWVRLRCMTNCYCIPVPTLAEEEEICYTILDSK